MEPSYAVLHDQEQDADLAALAAQYGRMLGFVNRMEESFEPLERALAIAERLGLWDTLSAALNTKGLWLLNLGRREEGFALLRGALDVALEHAAHHDSLRAYFNLGFAESLVDSTSNDYDRSGLALAQRIGDRGWERAFLMHLAGLAFGRGDWDEALALVHQASDAAGEMFTLGARGFPGAAIHAFRGDAQGAAELMESSALRPDSQDAQIRAGWAASEGTRLMAAGRWAEAAEAAARWADSEASMGLHHPASKTAFITWATCSYRLGDMQAARSFHDRVAALTPTERTPLYEAQRLKFAALLGLSEKAAADLAKAADILRDRNLRAHLMLLQADAAELLASSDPAAARMALDEARELAEHMGAVTVAERLEWLAPAPPAAAQA